MHKNTTPENKKCQSTIENKMVQENKADIVKGGKINNMKGRVVLDITTSNRNGEGAFFETKDGTILYIYSHFENGCRDFDSCSIASCYSKDRGETWSKEEVIVRPEEHNSTNLMCVSLLRMLNGDIGLFYSVFYGLHDTRIYLRRSSDEGKTWGPLICCIPAPGYFVINNDRVVRLSTGRIIIPANFHRMKYEAGRYDFKDFNLELYDHRGIAFFYYSDDDGLTWKEASQFCMLSETNSMCGLQETGLIELKNGVIWAWSRTSLGLQYESYSLDIGDTWTTPSPSVFRSPTSPLSMKRIPKSGHLLAVWNPMPCNKLKYPGIDVYEAGDRTPLVYAISSNEGREWGEHIILEDDKTKGYSYTTIYFTEEAVLLAYYVESTGTDKPTIKETVNVRIRKIMISDILAGYIEPDI